MRRRHIAINAIETEPKRPRRTWGDPSHSLDRQGIYRPRNGGQLMSREVLLVQTWQWSSSKQTINEAFIA